MTPFRSFDSTVVVLPFDDIDTDQIIPARYLKVTDKVGLGEHLFEDQRRHPDFPLLAIGVREAQILVAGANFGCGSSREHAPWALGEYGFRAIVAPSFADIFYGNCCQNGLLPVTLDDDVVAELFRRATASGGYELTVDLERTEVRDAAGFRAEFAIAPYRRAMLLDGLDEIGRTLRQEAGIAAFERRRAVELGVPV